MSLNNNFSENLGEPLSRKKLRRSTLKRVLSFGDIEDQVLIEETTKQIQDIKEQVKNEPLISLGNWCKLKGVYPGATVRLFNESGLPGVRIGEFQGVYNSELLPALDKEMERQLTQQVQNRVCAKLLVQKRCEKKSTKEGSRCYQSNTKQ